MLYQHNFISHCIQMIKQQENKEIANLLFPEIVQSKRDILEKYPKRELSDEQLVLRFAPSPTGFIHIGNIYTGLVGYILTKRTEGVFVLRIEDTDKTREVEKGISQIIEGLEYFGIKFDEGMVGENKEKGEYGPYKQSERIGVYKTFAKYLVAKGYAYPCFCTSQELETIRNEQNKLGCKTGYYGKWAKWRDTSLEDVKKELELGTPFVIRLYSKGNIDEKINVKDLIKGGMTLSQNDMDAVLLKSDGLPTYHFAHPIDDTLSHISFVLRGDEWLPSQPLHMEIFEALGFQQIQYGHISPLMKMDKGGKRKLSKRKDPEFAVSYYIEKGYPVEGVKEYLLNIANSNFYDWRIQNPGEDILNFNLKLEKFNKAGALFDITKLNDICKEYISTLSATQVYEYVLEWSGESDPEINKKLINQRDYCIRIFNIEREGDKIRKDIVKWSDVREQFEIFFDDIYIGKEEIDIEKSIQKDILNDFLDTYYFGDSTTEWFSKIQRIAQKYGFCLDSREYSKNPKKYKGKIGDVAMTIRVAVTGRKQTPDLYEVMQVMGESRVRERIKGYINRI